jgi:methionyl-tRNA formyltransferase
MLLTARPLSRLYFQVTFRSSRRSIWTTTKQIDPLKILFCGSEEFSITSLRTIVGLQEKYPHNIQSIDVVCRTDKSVGRGLKTVRQAPIKQVAIDLGLPIHQIDRFSDFKPAPGAYNLIVAVSFGLLIPAKLIEGATYGGLNVHPSYLPE